MAPTHPTNQPTPEGGGRLDFFREVIIRVQNHQPIISPPPVPGSPNKKPFGRETRPKTQLVPLPLPRQEEGQGFVRQRVAGQPPPVKLREDAEGLAAAAASGRWARRILKRPALH